MTAQTNHYKRHLAIVGVFCLVCLVYLGRLFYIQIFGDYVPDSGRTATRTVTVQAVRGEIYDRNGKPLVTNRYTYDLVLSYSALSSEGIRQANEACLVLSEALQSSGETDLHTEKFFPFEGAYPYYSFSDEARDEDSVTGYRMQKVLKAIGLDADAKVADIVEYYVATYDLLATDSADKRIFDDDKIDRLIRLRYDMDAQSFKTNGEYTYAKKVSLACMTYVKERALTGISFRVNVERVYNYPAYASHILGTVGPIYSEEWDYYNEQGYQMNAVVGKSGCELAFESYLHGQDGFIRITEDAAGRVTEVEVLEEPIAGNDVYLTIDIDLQIAAEDGLRDNVAYVVDRANGEVSRGSGANAGAAVAVDPETFEILAIASYPTYDLTSYNVSYNELLTSAGNPLFNRALLGLYAPGSTYKLGMAAAAMMEGEIRASSTVYCGGKYTVYEDYQPKCSTYPHTLYGTRLTVSQAIADSCNCFFYEMGYRLGIDTMNRYMKALGIGQSTGLELGGEVGVLAGPDYRQQIHGDLWTAGLTLQAAIGQSDNLVSPLQLACYTAALTNGGTRYSAHLLKSVYAFGSEEPSFSFTQTEETVLSRLDIPSDVLSVIRTGMRDVVRNNATVSRFLADIPATVTGKTGTAQNSSGCDNALFVCAAYDETAPEDTPDVVISVVIEQGYSGGYASMTAGRILQAYYANETET